MKIDLAQSLTALSDLTTTNSEGHSRNPVMEELDKPEVKTAVLALILNEIRAYKVASKNVRNGDSVYSIDYDTTAGFAKLSGWVDLLDIPALIESKISKPAAHSDDDRLPED